MFPITGRQQKTVDMFLTNRQIVDYLRHTKAPILPIIGGGELFEKKRKNYRESPCVRYCLLRSVML